MRYIKMLQRLLKKSVLLKGAASAVPKLFVGTAALAAEVRFFPMRRLFRHPLQTTVLLAVLVQSLSVRDAGASSAVVDPAVPVKLDRMDAGIDAIVPLDATIERVATGFTWVEGPIWIPAGYLMFAEITSNSIRKVTPDGTVSIFMQPSGYKGSAPYGGKEPGSNGMTLDAKGRLTVAGHAQRDVWRLESLDADAQVTVLADSYQGKKLNSPNDLVYRNSDGSLYFTDPPYGLPTQGETILSKSCR